MGALAHYHYAAMAAPLKRQKLSNPRKAKIARVGATIASSLPIDARSGSIVFLVLLAVVALVASGASGRSFADFVANFTFLGGLAKGLFSSDIDHQMARFPTISTRWSSHLGTG
jgi:hypothetical protein